ncbi:MAG: putative heme-binding domain-containing protein [Arcticibacterium sp.]|jgi:putative heme-binding domain-containing protein
MPWDFHSFIMQAKRIFSLLVIVFFVIAACTSTREIIEDTNPKTKKLKLTEGFMAEHLYSPSENDQGSWVAMTFDDKGRMITSDQYGSLYRLTIPASGSGSVTPNVVKLTLNTGEAIDSIGMGYANGLLYAFNSLYVMLNNGKNNKEFPRKSGLYRLQDTNQDDTFDKITLLKELVGQGEHGPHSIVLSPDQKSLYVIAGNHTDVPEMDSYRLPSNWQEDNLFPLIKDPRGHANDRMAPGGWIANLDPEGKHWELYSAGYRNAFDMAFNEAGDLFVYDADMEWDFGQPWYRPTRIVHATSASEFGWRTGNSKWSPTFPDNLPPVINIGQGSPTNLLHLKDAKFPQEYKNSLLAFDWSFGIIHAIKLRPEGGSYSAKREEFLSGLPLPLTDGVIGPDGALYFLTGGRRLESDLYRVAYTGNNNTDSIEPAPLTPENELRRSLEKLHEEGTTSEAIDIAWPHLSHLDRHVRYAARMVLEKQPVNSWSQKALNEVNNIAATQALISLARQGDKTLKDPYFSKLLSINYNELNESQQIDILRAFELGILRFGTPTKVQKANISNYLSSAYPAKTAQLNRSLSKILLYVDAPEAISKTLTLMRKKQEDTESLMDETATTSEDLIMRNPQYGNAIAEMLSKMPPQQHTYYATVLTMAKKNWTKEQREEYFSWFKKAFEFKGGMSYNGFINKTRLLALANVPRSELAYFEGISAKDGFKSGESEEMIYPEGPGRRWNTEQAVKLVEGKLQNRNFKIGQAMYTATTCKMCHTMNGEGGAIGPDLTQLGTRFSVKDMLESIIDPNKVVSDQYAATQFSLNDGSSIVGRLISENKETYNVSQNPYDPTAIEKIAKSDVISSKSSAVSTMFPGLINSLNKEELKDLIAYLMSGGDKENDMFTKD